MARKPAIKVPYNRMDFAVAEILARYHFVKSIEKKGKGTKRVMAITMEGKKRPLDGVKFVSLPSRRMYVGFKDLRPVRSGTGLAVLSTSKGILSDRDAKKQKLGGQLLFEIW